MNRSFRAEEENEPETQMQAMKPTQQQLSDSTTMKKKKKKNKIDKEEELSLFFDRKKSGDDDANKDHSLLLTTVDFDDASFDSNPVFRISSATRKIGGDDFLNSGGDKNDYDWLLTPPGTPLFPSLEMESHTTVMSQIGAPKAHPTVLRSRLANSQPEPPARGDFASKQQALPSGSNSSAVGIRRPSPSGGPGLRPATPTGRPALTTASKPSRSVTPNSRASLASMKPTVLMTTKSGASINKSNASSPKPTVNMRSSTPSRATVKSSTPTPTTRPAITSSKSTSRTPTPTRRTFAPSSAPSISASPNRSSPPSTLSKSLSSVLPVKSSPSAAPAKSSPSVTKPALTTRNPGLSHSASPTVKPKPWKPSEMPGYSLDSPPNLGTTLSDRPLSATRGRPGAPIARSSSVEPTPAGRPRRQSCSPSRHRSPNGIMHTSGSSVPAFSRGYTKANDHVTPVVIGTKMVERLINMRKLAAPKHGDKSSPLSGKSSSPDTTGFGRTLSKKSLDMAIRHMDIRGSIHGNLQTLMTNIPASSMYSVIAGPTRSRKVSASDSPIATSSNVSSEASVTNNGVYMNGTELEDEIFRERTGRSPLCSR